MKLASWNVNSVKVRLPQLLDWLAAEQPDVVCLQELKTGRGVPARGDRSGGLRLRGQRTKDL
jgi:exodeoxyribonuclease III